MSPQVTAYFRSLGKKGVGTSKKRSAEHYARVSALGVQARKAKREAQTTTVVEEKKDTV